jgi:hypothetical protein
MRRLTLDGHYGQRVEIDRCAPCHLVWFDSVESVRLAGTGMLGLLRDMADSQRQAHVLLKADARCPHCTSTLKTVHNRSRWGPTLQLECRARHGAYQTFAHFLSEKGLIRVLGSADRAALGAREGRLCCLNCGAAIGALDARCTYCDSLPGMIDIARLAHALDPEGATEAMRVHGVAPQHASLHCLACGGPLPTGPSTRCGHCGATLAVGALRDAVAAVGTLEAGLRAHAKSPAPHVRARRLAALEGDLPRRREWARQMEAETAATHGDVSDRNMLNDLRERPWTLAFAALLALLGWSLWR